MKEQLLQQSYSTTVTSDTLQDDLREERLKVLLKEQTIFGLEKKVERLTASSVETEKVLKQKEEDIYHTEVSAREQKIKAQAMGEKVRRICKRRNY